jgi:nitroimidazol reductase NimA-like FMN-containing flavoprotein (pyridoxamine 5'-phosphate oxidase superfamily)
MDDILLKSKILELLNQHRLMTVATNRPDGWPQVTTVGYVNDSLTIYFLCSPQSQKAANLARENRISLTVDHMSRTRWRSRAFRWQPRRSESPTQPK